MSKAITTKISKEMENLNTIIIKIDLINFRIYTLTTENVFFFLKNGGNFIIITQVLGSH